jgi:ABC-type branched-subunit amino acid transport system substrate-binding protein
MMINRRGLLKGGAVSAAVGGSAWFNGASAGEPGVSARQINLGTSLPLTGPLAGAGKDHVMALNAAFGAINRAGGIHDREIKLQAVDDGYVPARSAENVSKMIADNSVLGFISQIGTPNTLAVLPMLEKHGVPLLGPITGSSAIRNPQVRNVFHLRPSYGDEVTRMVEQLVRMGLEKIAFVYLDNAFGKEVLAKGEKALEAAKLTSMGAFALAFDGKNAKEVVEQVTASKAGAVFLATTGAGVTDFVLGLRAAAGGMPVVGLSVSYTDLERLGAAKAMGLAVAAVFPHWKAQKFALVRDYQADMDAMGLVSINGTGVESWIYAKVMAEALRRAGRDVNRDKLRAALASIRRYELGEMVINFSAAAPYVCSLPVKLGVYGSDLKLNV